MSFIYYDKSIFAYVLQHGRQFKQMSKIGEMVTFEYNEDGLRTKKTSTSKGVTEYTLRGKNIVHLTRGNQSLHFFYDGQDKPSIVEWNNGTTTTKYAYVYNLQGDVIALINSAGTKVVEYTYDAWGKPTSLTGEDDLETTLGTLNPFRYRGYVYDDETGLYYLRSRYYACNLNRFVNADDVLSINLFCYADNTPVSRIDSDGTDSIKTTASDDDFNDTITQGMRNLLYNASDYHYIPKSKDSTGGIDCIWAVNKGYGKTIAKKVDSAWAYFVNRNTKRGWIKDFSDLQPGDIIFSLDERDPNYSHPGKIKRIDHAMKGHIGIVVLFDFGDGNGEVLSVFQSCSKQLSPDKWTALYYYDDGPNITALMDNEGNSNWCFYVRPRK